MKLKLLLTAVTGLVLLVFGCSNLQPKNMSSAMKNSVSLNAAEDPANAPGAYYADGTALKFKDTVQPSKAIILAWDGEGEGKKMKADNAFDHEKHATDPKYSADGKAAVGCAECHHTDQPSAPKGSEFLKKFERDKVLTADNVKDKAVKTCRACHLRSADEPTDEYPPASIEYPKDAGRTASKDKIDNEDGYHLNCNTCHDQARKRAEPKTGPKMPQKCADCHTK
jgi:hypothetical protein